MADRNIEMDIICPLCNRYVKHYKGWGWNGVLAKCKKCQKLVAYDFEMQQFKIIKPPVRTSSGMTFY